MNRAELERRYELPEVVNQLRLLQAGISIRNEYTVGRNIDRLTAAFNIFVITNHFLSDFKGLVGAERETAAVIDKCISGNSCFLWYARQKPPSITMSFPPAFTGFSPSTARTGICPLMISNDLAGGKGHVGKFFRRGPHITQLFRREDRLVVLIHCSIYLIMA